MYLDNMQVMKEAKELLPGGVNSPGVLLLSAMDFKGMPFT